MKRVFIFDKSDASSASLMFLLLQWIIIWVLGLVLKWVKEGKELVWNFGGCLGIFGERRFILSAILRILVSVSDWLEAQEEVKERLRLKKILSIF